MQNIVKKYTIEFLEMFFDTPLEECIKRDKDREKPVGEAIIRKMWKDYLKPSNIHTDTRFILEQNINLPKCVICDLDGTLALHNGRSPFDDSKIYTDKLNNYIRRILNAYNYLGTEIIYLSGRSETAREETEKWLVNNGCWYKYNQKLYMRIDKDYRADNIVKKELFEKFIKDKYFVNFVLDDRDQVVKMWRDLGLLCLQVYYGDF